MKSFEQHLSDVRGLVSPRPAEHRSPLDALGLLLADDVRAPADAPAFASSAMDGYAVRVADVPGTLIVVGEVAAGRVPDVAVGAGRAVRVMTGSALPAGTEAVVPIEDTEADTDSNTDAEGGAVHVRSATERGRFLRGAGTDLRAGQLLLPAGTLVGPAQLAALAPLSTVAVRPRIRVAVLSTGDELMPLGAPLGPAQLHDTNGPALAAAAAQAGAEVVHLGRCADEPRALLAALDALPEVDLVVTSGGVSMGSYDVVKAALAPLGLTFEQVAMQPGKPQGWGRLPGGAAFLGLPGNPVSALVCFELFGRAVLGRERPTVSAVLREPVAGSPRAMRQYRRGTLDRAESPGVRLEGGPGSHLVAALARSDCLVVVPVGVSDLPVGAAVEIVGLQA